eukprot:9418898-Alexandrium_andersonii.AAC.1
MNRVRIRRFSAAVGDSRRRHRTQRAKPSRKRPSGAPRMNVEIVLGCTYSVQHARLRASASDGRGVGTIGRGRNCFGPLVNSKPARAARETCSVGGSGALVKST